SLPISCGVSGKGYPMEEWNIGLTCGLMGQAGTQIHCREAYPPLIYTLPTSGTYYLNLGCAVGQINYFVTLRALEVAASSVARDHRDVGMAGPGDGGASWGAK